METYIKLDGSIAKIEKLKPNFKSVVNELFERIEKANCKPLCLKITIDIAIISSECSRKFLWFVFENEYNERLSVRVTFDGIAIKKGKLTGEPIDATINCEGVHKTII